MNKDMQFQKCKQFSKKQQKEKAGKIFSKQKSDCLHMGRSQFLLKLRHKINRKKGSKQPRQPMVGQDVPILSAVLNRRKTARERKYLNHGKSCLNKAKNSSSFAADKSSSTKIYTVSINQKKGYQHNSPACFRKKTRKAYTKRIRKNNFHFNKIAQNSVEIRDILEEYYADRSLVK